MIAIDTNVLVYAHRMESAWHERAERVVRGFAEGTSPWAIPWPCVHEFLAIVTHPRIYGPPTPLGRALEQVDAWLESPSLRLLSEQGGYFPTLRAILSRGRITGPRVHDARIAAICTQWGVTELWSADRDFGRFPGIRVVNPLLPAAG